MKMTVSADIFFLEERTALVQDLELRKVSRGSFEAVSDCGSERAILAAESRVPRW